MSRKLIHNSLMIAVLAISATAPAVVAQQRRNFQSQSRSQSESTRAASQADAAATVFRSARDLITDGQWARAQAKFDEYISSYPNEKNLDAALYWMAYAENKLAKYDDCRQTIERLMEKFPSSSWRDDARVLLAQVPGAVTYAPYAAGQRIQPVRTVRGTAETVIDPDRAPGQTAATTLIDPAQRPGEATIVYSEALPTTPVAIAPLPGQAVGFGTTTVWSVDEFGDSNDDDPCEFKIVVLQALFQTDMQRGIMAATEWLKPGSAQTVRCKSAALTLLGRHGGKSVTPVILGVARSEPDPKLRARAISTLGATNDDTVIDALRDFALTSQENEIVEASLYALSKHTGDRAIAVLSDIAVSGKTVSQRKLAISSISTRPGEPAVDALFRIYDADQNVEIRKAVVYGFANRKSERAGNKLVEIARSSDNLELRKAAISGISRRGGDKAIDFLLSLYDSEKNEDLKDQILNSLASGTTFITSSDYSRFIDPSVGGSSRLSDQRVVQKLIEIARNQQAPMDRRRRAIGWLSRSKDPAVLKFLEELLK